MARNKLKIKQSDLTRALKAIQKVGADFSLRVEQDGSLLLVKESDKKEDRRTKEKGCPAL